MDMVHRLFTYQLQCVHSCTCSVCENSVRNKNPKSLQVVCVCVCVCVCVGKKKLKSQQVVLLSWKGIKNDELSKGMPRKALSCASPPDTEI